MSDVVFLLWSNKHRMWWGPNRVGYTIIPAEAGRYTEAEAVECVVRSAHHGRLDQVTCMVAAPDNWNDVIEQAMEPAKGGTDG